MFRRCSLPWIIGLAALGQEPSRFPDRSPFTPEAWISAQPPNARLEAARTAERERQLVDRVNRFAAIFNKFTAEFNEKRSLNVRVAREVSEAFRALENGEFLPKREAFPRRRLLPPHGRSVWHARLARRRRRRSLPPKVHNSETRHSRKIANFDLTL
jgi:hypothetical protein